LPSASALGAGHVDGLETVQVVAEQLSSGVVNILANEELLEREREKSILLGISEDMSAIRNKNDLLKVLHERMKKILYISHTVTLLIDMVRQTYTGFVFDPKSLSRMYPEYARIATQDYSLDDPLMQLVLGSREPALLDLDMLMAKPGVPEWIKMNHTSGIREMVIVQLNVGERLVGCLAILSDKKGQYSHKQLRLIHGISYQVGVAISNIVANEELVARENEKSILLAISNEIAAIRYKTDLSKLVNEKLKRVLPISHVLTGLISEDRQWYSAFMLDSQSASRNHPEYVQVTSSRYPVSDGILEYVLSSDQPIVYDLAVLMRRPAVPAYLKMNYDCGMREAVFCALGDAACRTGVMVVFSATQNLIRSNHLGLIKGIASQLSTAVSNILANEKIDRQLEEISRFKQQLEIEKLYLQEEIQTTHNYGEIIGSSPAMRKVFQLVSKVAETTTTVLLMGETGTGKELIARALHNTSPRRDKLMVKVNCAALPANLIESELFGHERGSFTGATDRKIGKFELANNSTLFLDEIGELPLDLQAKILRALQEKEIERVGGRAVIRTDVRIIAATNRDLQKEVQAGHFRSDLFYRLNVFPITIPPLRHRKEDIANLATHFVHKHAKKGKGAMNFSSKVLKELTAYHWPGNVRELEHLIERSILLNSGATISSVHLPVTEREELKQLLPDAYIKTIDEVEREHIISVLKVCNGKVAGVGGAAEKLRIPSTTLTSKIRRLNIRKGYLDE
jgi:formate hydrogenlyase transcriptional activator